MYMCVRERDLSTHMYMQCSSTHLEEHVGLLNRKGVEGGPVLM